MGREGGEFPTGRVWGVEVPNSGEEVVEDDDEWGTTVLKEPGGETRGSGGFIFGRGVVSGPGSREGRDVEGEGRHGVGGG